MIRLTAPGLLRFLGYFTSFAAVGLAAWIDHTFGEPSIDQILYHLHYSEGAAVQMGQIFIFTFIAEVIAFPFGFAVAAHLAHGAVERRWPAWRAHVLKAALPAAALWGVAALLLQFSVFSYAAAQLGPDRFAELYVDPNTVKLHDGPRSNLIIIYAESLEETYGDPQAFGRDLLAPLRQLGGQRFANYQPAEGATWTMAGIVASQCGVPLKVYSEYDIRRQPGSARVFLPGATCLGDILAARGYRNVFLGGAPLSFAGKGSFLRDHGYTNTYGRDEWEKAGAKPEELNEWGLYDSALLQRARSKLDELHASGQPFNLTLLTLDTHNPHGFMSPACRARGARDFSGIVDCAATQLADFVRFVEQRGYLRDTRVVIIGDHLAVPNPLWTQLQQARHRSIFNLVLARPQIQFNRADVLPFDMFPTLLELAGTAVEGDRLGLGYSAAFQTNVVRPQGGSPITLGALRGSRSYRALWEPGDSLGASGSAQLP
ncbi:MAG TPA: sulfatase-like hydrolase/transferase [Ramlibacter sp.]|jgi:phosphoglycerol transferase|uniref:sulfatase-like hydrolase/transferase n=1 Tax=Ramlibacter sp. TaxID=1917967 RepID=UPI002D6EB50F|nr:sulfatase-like hydrolase/transferase [Ramlibacter sp.]HZY17121.1 sulfatase-like hydrolase/transferase [Ramlibacter sp.]